MGNNWYVYNENTNKSEPKTINTAGVLTSVSAPASEAWPLIDLFFFSSSAFLYCRPHIIPAGFQIETLQPPPPKMIASPDKVEEEWVLYISAEEGIPLGIRVGGGFVQFWLALIKGTLVDKPFE